ncbi:MAG: hypothetical protein WBM90_07830, partial [Acidimicrobiia bacterium]
FSALINHSLHPALALPIADSGAPPASIQIIGPLWSEPNLIALGNELERAEVVKFQAVLPNSPNTNHG